PARGMVSEPIEQTDDWFLPQTPFRGLQDVDLGIKGPSLNAGVNVGEPAQFNNQFAVRFRYWEFLRPIGLWRHFEWIGEGEAGECFAIAIGNNIVEAVLALWERIEHHTD